MSKLEELYAERDRINRQIVGIKKRQFRPRVRHLLKTFENTGRYEDERWAKFLKSILVSPQDLYVIGLRVRDIADFCYKNDIPFEYDTIVREFHNNMYDNFRIGEFRA
jgi:hypothetical protein